VLGEGYFGIVYKGKWSGQPVAVKRLKHGVRKGEISNFKAEVKMLGKLRHPNITTFYGISLSSDDQEQQQAHHNGIDCLIITELLASSLYDVLYPPDNYKIKDPSIINDLEPIVLLYLARDIAKVFYIFERRNYFYD